MLSNEQRLIIQLVVGIIACLCGGTVFCFGLFGNVFKAPPFNYSESEVSTILSLSAIASFFNFPMGLVFDHCGGPRATLLIGGTCVALSWYGLYFFVFSSSGSGDGDGAAAPHLATVIALFCSAMSFSTCIEMGIIVANLDAFRLHQGWLVIMMKSMIGVGSSLVSLIFTAGFATNDNALKAQYAGNFCIFLGSFAAFACYLGAAFTTAPPLSVSTSAAAGITFGTTSWDVRVIGVNMLPSAPPGAYGNSPTNNGPGHRGSDDDNNDVIDAGLRLNARARFRPLMRRGLWLLLIGFLIVIIGNVIELCDDHLPQAVYITIAAVCCLMPLIFFSLLKLIPEKTYNVVPSETITGGHVDGDQHQQQRVAVVDGSTKKKDYGSMLVMIPPSAVPVAAAAATAAAAAAPGKLKEGQDGDDDDALSFKETDLLSPPATTGGSNNENDDPNSPAARQRTLDQTRLKVQGNQEYNNKRYPEAVELYTRALSVNPQNTDLCATIYSNRSGALHALNRFDESVRDAVSCIRAKPKWFKGYYRRGVSLEALGQLEDSIRDLDAALSLDPSNTDVSEKLHSVKAMRFMKKAAQANKKKSGHAGAEAGAAEAEGEEPTTSTSYQAKIIALIEEQMGKSRRMMPLVDVQDEFEELPALNDNTVCQNLAPSSSSILDMAVLWAMFFCLWGSQVMVYSNTSSIYHALQGDGGFSSTRNAVFVSIFGLGNAMGRALAGFCVPILQGRALPIWALLRVAPLVNMMALMFFPVTRGAGLGFPFFLCGIATGFTWGSTIIFTKRVFANAGQHYAFFYTAGAGGILAFCLGLFATEYEHYAESQFQQHQHLLFSTTTTTTTIIPPVPTTTFHNNSSGGSDAAAKNCKGLECVGVAFGVVVACNFIAYVAAEFLIHRLNCGALDTVLQRRDAFQKQTDGTAKKKVVEKTNLGGDEEAAGGHEDADDEDDDTSCAGGESHNVVISEQEIVSPRCAADIDLHDVRRGGGAL